MSFVRLKDIYLKSLLSPSLLMARPLHRALGIGLCDCGMSNQVWKERKTGASIKPSSSKVKLCRKWDSCTQRTYGYCLVSRLLSGWQDHRIGLSWSVCATVGCPIRYGKSEKEASIKPSSSNIKLCRKWDSCAWRTYKWSQVSRLLSWWQDHQIARMEG